MVLASGQDIRMVLYEQQDEVEKSCLKLETNILWFVADGKKWIYHPDGKIEIGAGQGAFLSRGNYLWTGRGCDREHGLAALVIALSDEYLSSFGRDGSARGIEPAADDSETIGGSAAHLQQDLLVDGLLKQLIQYFSWPDEKKRLEGILALKMRELLALLASSPENNGFESLLRRLPGLEGRPLRVLMEAHFRESLSLEQWAFLAGLGLSSFKRKFESVFHMPPKRWIQERRLEEAHMLLCERNRNVTEICYAVGFENPAHFVQTFKDRYGVTPKQLQLG